MTEQQIMNYIELTSENTALKVQQKITEAIAAHEKSCAGQFCGRIEMIENAVVNLAKKTENRFDSLGPVMAVLFKNWKVLVVAAVIAVSAINGLRSGKSYSIEDIKEIVKQVQQAELPMPQKATEPQTVSTAPVEKDKEDYQIN